MNLSLHKTYTRKLLFCLFLGLNFFSVKVFTQAKNYTVANAHAHNDYEHTLPFYTAYHAGFGSIEADVFPVNGVLAVAHSKKEIKAQRTLKSLYLDPLLKELLRNPKRKVKLLIDIKENYKESLQLLMQELGPLKKYLVTSSDKNKPVTILISGERPAPNEYKDYPAYIFFDDDLKLFHTPGQWKRIGLVSLSFERYSSWNGEGPIADKDINLLIHTIDSVHHAGKQIRFWAAPDNETSWILQMKLGVDLVGTDKIEKFSEFLRERNTNPM